MIIKSNLEPSYWPSGGQKTTKLFTLYCNIKVLWSKSDDLKAWRIVADTDPDRQIPALILLFLIRKHLWFHLNQYRYPPST